MATQFYVPGPSYLYVGQRQVVGGPVTSYNFLGFCESEVTVALAAGFEDVLADYGGPMVPVDSQFMGESAFVGATLTRFNEEILFNQQIRAGRLEVNNALGTGFSMTPGSVGSLMIQEGWALPLVIVSGYVGLEGKPSSVRLPRGYTFFNTWLHDNFEFGLGMRVLKPRCLWRAIPAWDECLGRYATWGPSIPTNLPDCNINYPRISGFDNPTAAPIPKTGFGSPGSLH